MKLFDLILKDKKYFKNLFNKDTFKPINLIYFITILTSIITAFIGFGSAVLQFYIGDFWVRILLTIIGILFCFLIVYSYLKLQKKLQLVGMIIFTIIIFLLAYFLPLFPPSYDLRQYDVDASIIKFFIVSITLVLVGLFGTSYSMKPMYNFSRRSNQMAAYFILIFSIIIIIYPLIVIVGNIVANGIGGISWEFFIQDVSRHGAEGGISSALIGTLFIIIGTILIALPLGIGSAIYLNEYAKSGPIMRIIRIAVDILQGVPSIVHGLFGLAVFVPIFGVSVLTGIIIMSFLTLPIIIRASEEALHAVPKSIREGSYAVGASKWQTIRRVVIPPALPGIITGGVLGLGRAAGETAPLMFTAAVFMGAGIPRTLFDPIQTLPTHLLQLTYYIGAYEVEQNAWSTAFLLLAIVLGMNAIAIIIREKFRVEF